MTATHFSRVRDSLLYQLRTALSKNSFMTDSGLSLICTTMKLAMLVVVLSCLACATASSVRVRTLSGIGTCLRPLTVLRDIRRWTKGETGIRPIAEGWKIWQKHLVVLSAKGGTDRVFRKTGRLQALKTVRFSTFRVQLEIIRNPIFCQKLVKGYALDFDGMALHSVSAGSGAIERAKYVSFIVNPKRNLARLIDDPDTFDQDLSRGDLLLKPGTRALHENRISFDCHHLVSLRQIMSGVVAIVHANVKDDVGATFRSLKLTFR